jgi:hypothetical protein
MVVFKFECAPLILSCTTTLAYQIGEEVALKGAVLITEGYGGAGVRSSRTLYQLFFLEIT